MSNFTFQLLLDKLSKLVDVARNSRGEMSIMSRVKLMWNDQAMKDLANHIQGQSSALQLLLSAIHL
jgi:cytochrome c553